MGTHKRRIVQLKSRSMRTIQIPFWHLKAVTIGKTLEVSDLLNLCNTRPKSKLQRLRTTNKTTTKKHGVGHVWHLRIMCMQDSSSIFELINTIHGNTRGMSRSVRALFIMYLLLYFTM